MTLFPKSFGLGSKKVTILGFKMITEALLGTSGNSCMAIHKAIEQNAVTARFIAELDDPVQKVYLVLRLFETNLFSTLLPIDINLEITKLGEQGALHGVSLEVQDEKWLSQNNPVEAYKITLASTSQGVITNRKEQMIVTGRSAINSISIPLPMWAIQSNAFRTMRDLNNAEVLMSFSTSLTSRVERAELLVNGWSLLKVEPPRCSWRLENVMADARVPGQRIHTLLASSPTSTRPVALWLLQLHANTHDYFADAAGPVTLSETADVRFFSDRKGQTNLPVGKQK